MHEHWCEEDSDGCCIACGVSMTNPCDTCGGAGHHKDGCEEMDGEKAQEENVLLTLNSEDLTEAVRDLLWKRKKNDILHGKVHFEIDRCGNIAATIVGKKLFG